MATSTAVPAEANASLRGCGGRTVRVGTMEPVTVAAVLLAAGGGSRFFGAGHKLLAKLDGRPVVSWALEAATAAGFNEIIVVQGAVELESVTKRAERNGTVPLTILHNPKWADGQATSLALAIDYAREQGHGAVVVGLGDQPAVGVSAWRTVGATRGDIVTARFRDRRRPPVKLDSTIWDLLPTSGDDGARTLMEARPDLVVEVACVGDPADIDSVEDLRQAQSVAASEVAPGDIDDHAMVTELLGRTPQPGYSVTVRRNDRSPIVLANRPLNADGTPMPTRFWLCDPLLVKAISQIESAGGVRRAEAELDPDAVSLTHRYAAAERESLMPPDYAGPRPFGGVGGTRTGVKCLHTHFANYLAGAPDVIGAWTELQLAQAGNTLDLHQPGIGSA